MRADLLCSASKLSLNSSAVKTLLNQTVSGATQDGNLAVDDAYKAGLNAVFGQDILDQIQNQVNDCTYSSMDVKHQDVIDSLVKDLHMNKTNRNAPKFSLALQPLSAYEIVSLKAKSLNAATLLFSNSYNFTLEQTSGDEVDNKPCSYQHKVTVSFEATITFDSKKRNFNFQVKQNKIALYDYFERNGYKRALIDSLEKTLSATYLEEQLFAPAIQKALNDWSSAYDLRTVLFGNELKADDNNLTFFSNGTQFILSYQPEATKKTIRNLTKIMGIKVKRNLGKHVHKK